MRAFFVVLVGRLLKAANEAGYSWPEIIAMAVVAIAVISILLAMAIATLRSARTVLMKATPPVEKAVNRVLDEGLVGVGSSLGEAFGKISEKALYGRKGKPRKDHS